MKPIINPIYFYLISVCGEIKLGLMYAGILGATGAAIAFIAFIIMKEDAYSKEVKERAENYIKKSIKYFIVCIVICFISSFVPSESTCYKMMAASIVTPDNIATAGNSAQDITDYIIDTINKVSEEKTFEGDK